MKNPNVQRANAAMSPGMETSLFGCCSDPAGCALAYCCGCVLAGFNAARVDDRECTPCDIFSNDYQVCIETRSIVVSILPSDNCGSPFKTPGRKLRAMIFGLDRGRFACVLT